MNVKIARWGPPDTAQTMTWPALEQGWIGARPSDGKTIEVLKARAFTNGLQWPLANTATIPKPDHYRHCRHDFRKVSIAGYEAEKAAALSILRTIGKL